MLKTNIYNENLQKVEFIGERTIKVSINIPDGVRNLPDKINRIYNILKSPSVKTTA